MTGTSDGLLQSVVEKTTVGDAGQCVVMSDSGQFCLVGFYVGDVGKNANIVRTWPALSRTTEMESIAA